MSHTRMKGLEKYCHPSAVFEDRISVADGRVVEAESDVHAQIAFRLLVDITTLGPRLEWLDENGDLVLGGRHLDINRDAICAAYHGLHDDSMGTDDIQNAVDELARNYLVARTAEFNARVLAL